MLNLKSNEIKAELIRHGLSQVEIARRLSVNRQMVGYVLRTWGCNRARNSIADRIQIYLVRRLSNGFRKAA